MIEGMTKREGDRFVFAEVGEPIPGEHARRRDHQNRRRYGGDGVQESVGVGWQIAFEDGGAGMIEDVGEHASCVQIDAGIECVRLFCRSAWNLLEEDEPS